MVILGIFVIAAIVILIILISKASSPSGPPSGPPAYTKIYEFGSELFISRTAYPYPQYVLEAKRRIMILLNNLPFHLVGYDLSAIAAIIAWETGWISDPNAYRAVVEKNNLMGITTGGSGVINRTFSNNYNCITFFKNMIETYPRYAVAKIWKGSGDRFIHELWVGGYNSNLSWKNGILSIYNNW
ncbi:MAG: hypothetical protein KG012_03360 [Deltaproteobacteria bacterium]|nr:hypothetical protein [Deltaproteobacteria bacterium]